MLTKIKIKPSYSTLEDDFASDFFIPVLSNSNRFYRVSAYFNSKSLSEYIEGMKFFAENKGKYKLIVSKEISNEEFEEIKYIAENLGFLKVTSAPNVRSSYHAANQYNNKTELSRNNIS